MPLRLASESIKNWPLETTPGRRTPNDLVPNFNFMADASFLRNITTFFTRPRSVSISSSIDRLRSAPPELFPRRNFEPRLRRQSGTKLLLRIFQFDPDPDAAAGFVQTGRIAATRPSMLRSGNALSRTSARFRFVRHPLALPAPRHPARRWTNH